MLAYVALVFLLNGKHILSILHVVIDVAIHAKTNPSIYRPMSLNSIVVREVRFQQNKYENVRV